MLYLYYIMSKLFYISQFSTSRLVIVYKVNIV